MGKRVIVNTVEKKQLLAGYVLLLVAAFAVVLAFGGSTYIEVLRYQRDAIFAGQLWRLLTASFVHLNWSHTLMNIGALIIIWGLFGHVLANRVWVLITLGCALGVSAGILLLNPEISSYVGLSGILHGYFTAGAVAERWTHKRTTAVMLLLVSSKLLWEQIVGPMPGSAETAGGNIIVDAHLYGAITGLVLGWYFSREGDTKAKRTG
ncbi:MAG TPA: rhombosortase [Gammaproteobacteria bacterium]|nr:rhombosortase [Gammaproteobacteria bacterium]